MKKFFTFMALTSFTYLSADYNLPNQKNLPENKNYRSSAISTEEDNKSLESDHKINNEIRDILRRGWISKGFQHVSYEINNGIIDLKGTVDSPEHKKQIEESIRNIDGVKTVNNRIAIAKESPEVYSENRLQNSEKKYPQDSAATPADRQINAKIRDKLGNAWFTTGYEGLIMKTANGIVIITGIVEKPEEIQKVTDQVKSVEGVKSVNNRVKVKDR